MPDATAPPLDRDTLLRSLKARYPGVRIAWLDPPASPGGSSLMSVANWPTSDPGHRIDEVFVDAATAAVLGARSTVNPGLNRAEAVHWIRRFHYTLMLKRTGMVLMGIVAIAWTIDCFGGALLTLPRVLRGWRKWRLAWLVKPTRLNFDLHRAGGLWLWPVLFVLALSSVYLNLAHEVFVPVATWLTHLLFPEHLHAPVGDALLEWQYPLHTGEAFGLTGRIVVFLSGFAITALAVTGIVTTVRKLRPRRPATCASMSSSLTEPLP